MKPFRSTLAIPAGVGVAGVIVLAAAAGAAPVAKAPSKHPVTNTYWGVDIEDDYQYFEDGADSEATSWVEEANEATRTWLDDWPMRAALTQRVLALTHAESPIYYTMIARGGHVFAFKDQPPAEQPFVVRIDSMVEPGAEKIVVDPNAIDPEGNTSIDFFQPSLTGRYVAVSLSKNGTEDGTVYVFDVETGQRLPDEIERVNGGTAGGSLAWDTGDAGFLYTRYPHAGERPDEDLPFYQQLWFHELGKPVAEDRRVLGESFPRIAEIDVQTSEDGRYVMARVSNGDGGEHEYWLRGASENWTKFAGFRDWVSKAAFGHDGAIYLLSRRDAPRFRILRMPIDDPRLAAARVVVPETDVVVDDFEPTASRLYVRELVGGPTRLHIYDLKGQSIGRLKTDEIGRVSNLTALDGDRLLFKEETYTKPEAWFSYEPGSDGPSPTRLVNASPADFGDCEVRREFAVADDGVKIPVNIILQKGTKLDGRAPCILYAYGSYGSAEEPRFRTTRRLWIEQGGVYAVANVRGGGEYGDAWHRAGSLERKKRSMDDLAACAHHLCERGYTSRGKLALRGGSAGGFLVYGTMVHHPDAAAAVLSEVGFGDALRIELTPNGEFNTTEFGTVKNEAQFRAMQRFSPYHHVADGTTYPAVLSLTGLNDPRVASWQVFKMTARLAASGSPNPVLLRVSAGTGHGGGTSLSDGDSELIDSYTFLFKQLGVDYRPIDQRAD